MREDIYVTIGLLVIRTSLSDELRRSMTILSIKMVIKQNQIMKHVLTEKMLAVIGKPGVGV